MEENLEELKAELEKTIEEYKNMTELQEKFIQSAGLKSAFQEFLRNMEEEKTRQDAAQIQQMQGEQKVVVEETKIYREEYKNSQQENRNEHNQSDQRHVKKARTL